MENLMQMETQVSLGSLQAFGIAAGALVEHLGRARQQGRRGVGFQSRGRVEAGFFLARRACTSAAPRSITASRRTDWSDTGPLWLQLPAAIDIGIAPGALT